MLACIIGALVIGGKTHALCTCITQVPRHFLSRHRVTWSANERRAALRQILNATGERERGGQPFNKISNAAPTSNQPNIPRM